MYIKMNYQRSSTATIRAGEAAANHTKEIMVLREQQLQQQQQRTILNGYSLPEAPPLYEDATNIDGDVGDRKEGRIQNYTLSNERLDQFKNARKEITDDIILHGILSKKYSRAKGALENIGMGCSTTCVAFGTAGLATSVTIAGLPVALPLAAAGGIIGLIGLTCSGIAKKLGVKERKHKDIAILARSKSNSISVLICKSVADGVVSDVEYNIIMQERDNYRSMKADSRAKITRGTVGDVDDRDMIEDAERSVQNDVFMKKNIQMVVSRPV